MPFGSFLKPHIKTCTRILNLGVVVIECASSSPSGIIDLTRSSISLVVAQSGGRSSVIGRITQPYGGYKTCRPMSVFPVEIVFLPLAGSRPSNDITDSESPPTPHLLLFPCMSQALFFLPRFLIFCASMFNGSSNIIIQGGTFIIAGNAGNIDSASLSRCPLT